MANPLTPADAGNVNNLDSFTDYIRLKYLGYRIGNVYVGPQEYNERSRNVRPFYDYRGIATPEWLNFLRTCAIENIMKNFSNIYIPTHYNISLLAAIDSYRSSEAGTDFSKQMLKHLVNPQFGTPQIGPGNIPPMLQITKSPFEVLSLVNVFYPEFASGIHNILFDTAQQNHDDLITGLQCTIFDSEHPNTTLHLNTLYLIHNRLADPITM